MKKELIKTVNYLLIVDDSEIKEGDWMYRNNEEPILVTPNFWWDFQAKYYKIIAHLPLNNSPILEGVPLLPPLEDDAEILAEKLSKEYSVYETAQDDVYQGIIVGYNKAREKYKFTEEQARQIWKAGQEYWKTSGDSITFEELTERFQSLSQPKLPSYFDFKLGFTLDETSPQGGATYIRTTTNSQGQEVACGKYIY